MVTQQLPVHGAAVRPAAVGVDEQAWGMWAQKARCKAMVIHAYLSSLPGPAAAAGTVTTWQVLTPLRFDKAITAHRVSVTEKMARAFLKSPAPEPAAALRPAVDAVRKRWQGLIPLHGRSLPG